MATYIRAQEDGFDYTSDYYNLSRAEVENILPEWFRDENQKFIEFLNVYYEYLNDADNFGGIIRRAEYLRNVDLVDETFLPNLDQEYLAGRGIYDGIKDLRKSIQLANIIYRSKGSEEGIKLFFKLFYNKDVVVNYTRDQILKTVETLEDSNGVSYTVGGLLLDSTADSDSGFRLVNDKLYQELAIQIVTSLDSSEYVDSYKKLAHPAGMYFEHKDSA